jgi:hypothetical protein
MVKRNSKTTRGDAVTNTTGASGTAMGETLEPRLVAFAEELGRVVGTLQAKAEGWMNREALTTQIARVRDGAAELLEQLAAGATKPSASVPAAAAAHGNTKGRSGGVVDAPGKKHRKPMPADPGANQAASQANKMRTARTMVKTNRRRGRG